MKPITDYVTVFCSRSADAEEVVDDDERNEDEA
jgi:hypothetical protein